MAESGPVLAVDVGGTKLAVAVVLPTGVVLGASVRPTPQGAGAEELFSALLGLVRSVLSSVGLSVVGAGVGCGGPMEWPAGVGCGGPMEWPAGVVSPVNIPGWRSFPLAARLSAELGVPVRIHNDAVCAAIAEHWRGAGRGHSSMLGMVVSTGVGGGLILGGRVWDGASGNAGHVGHIVVDPTGPVCGCGGRGHLEAVARGPAVVTWALAAGWTPAAAANPPPAGRPAASEAEDDHPHQPGDHGNAVSHGPDGHQVGNGDRERSPAGGRAAPVEGRAAPVDGRAVPAGGRAVPAGGRAVPADGRALAADARAGDPVALAAYERAGTMLGRGIASAVAAFDVTAVVVGGGFAASGDLLFGPLRRAFDAYAGLEFVRAVTIVPAALGAETGLLGAAALVLEEDRYWPRAR